MTEPVAILAITPADLTWLLRNLTIEIIASLDDTADPQRRLTAQRLRRVAAGLRQMDETSLSPPLHRVVMDLADQIDTAP